MSDKPLAEVALRDVLYVHWPIEASKLRPLVPDALTIDTHSGSAWISAVSVKLAEAKVRHVPRRPSAVSINLRTYVSAGEESGVYFLDLEIDDMISSWFGRLGFGMPYYHAQIERGYQDGAFTVESTRNRRGMTPARFSATVRPDTEDVSGIESGSLDEFLTERTNYFFEAGPRLRSTIEMLGTTTGVGSPKGSGSGMFAGAAEHDPWEITAAEGTVDAGTLFQAAEIPQPDGEPRFNYARQQLMRMARIRELSIPTQG